MRKTDSFHTPKQFKCILKEESIQEEPIQVEPIQEEPIQEEPIQVDTQDPLCKDLDKIKSTNDSAPKLDSNKPDLSLIPYDFINEMLLPAYEEGLQEYYRDSWRLGFPVLKMCSAILRHFFAFMLKHEDYDPIAMEKYGIKKHHLGAVMFGCIAIYNSLKMDQDKFDDRR